MCVCVCVCVPTCVPTTSSMKTTKIELKLIGLEPNTICDRINMIQSILLDAI